MASNGGARLLGAWVDTFAPKVGRQRRASKLLGISESYLSRLLKGRTPSIALARLCEEIAGIPMPAWFEE